MALSARMDMKQGQGLVMTPQLQQAIKLLQLSNVELQAYVEQELERNPILERIEDETDFSSEDFADNEQALRDGAGDEMSMSADGSDPRADEALDAHAQDIDNDADMPAVALGAVNDWSSASNGSNYDFAEMEDSLTQKVSLRDHIEAQVVLAFHDVAERMIATHLVDSVDESGYLRLEMDDTAARLGVSVETLESIIAVMQTFEPVGICARSLEECLAIQLKERDRFDPAMKKLIENLPLLARRDLGHLCEICEVDGEDLADMIREIRALTPRPGNGFDFDAAQTVVPDIIVKEGQNGTWHIELNSETLPKVLVNSAYAETVSRHARSEDEKSFISECAAEASWLVRSLDQRARTILKVAREIIRQQDSFLTYGVSHLRPIILKDIAAAIEMHESTVSRVTSGKYMATPRGVFELKYFFTTAISASDGGIAHSSESVRHQIRSLIDGEQSLAPLSDDRIVEILRETGVDIARRTVAKYREALHIPSSVMRRKSAGAGF